MALGTTAGASANVTDSELFGAKPDPVTVTEPPGATESGVTVAGDEVAAGTGRVVVVVTGSVVDVDDEVVVVRSVVVVVAV